MIQQVNLYTDELRPHKERLQAGTAVGVLLVGLLLVAFVAGFLIYENSVMANKASRLDRQNQQLEQAVAELSAAVQARQPDAEVEEALNRVTQTLARRQRLLERVESLVLSEGRNFSPQLSALARQIPKDVWLTDVILESAPDKVTIEGRSRDGALVPRYLENLGDEAAFAGKTFGAFRLSRSDEGRWIDFHVSSKRDGETN
ncbi:PilN domain-containing protein [Marinobacter adhaerens]|jgi:MSHA biogenesis protein MshI|uniref:PilN domain-containing protein n=1 Tax=Marinobacter adhaerens TaxID=1033846 RepID=A0ABX8IKM3_9GAMM|nr:MULTISPECIES: PilN domain-containing protein [Marinobacter]MBW3228376.1 PilN domain-containing protein [Marinobacter adhaerens]MBW4980128.1 PilN domain-containing protein [Marinobacter adhaerens]QWV14185.1 PilN domain-containing protein [Marinobacter adhaerens]ROQ38914.1 MSHA biogenesis protein MshI [Marinobacter sp. 3-2]